MGVDTGKRRASPLEVAGEDMAVAHFEVSTSLGLQETFAEVEEAAHSGEDVVAHLGDSETTEHQWEKTLKRAVVGDWETFVVEKLMVE